MIPRSEAAAGQAALGAGWMKTLSVCVERSSGWDVLRRRLHLERPDDGRYQTLVYRNVALMARVRAGEALFSVPASAWGN